MHARADEQDAGMVGANAVIVAVAPMTSSQDSPEGDASPASCCAGMDDWKGMALTMWSLDWHLLWIVTLVLLLLACWLLVRERGRNRRHEARLAVPLLPSENESLALAWEHELAQEAQSPVTHSDVSASLPASAQDAPAELHETAIVAPGQLESSPLAAVFNRISSPGGVCARRSVSEALRWPESIIRANVDVGEGRGMSFKIAGVVEWPLWARLRPQRDATAHHQGLFGSLYPGNAIKAREPDPIVPEAPAMPGPKEVTPEELVDALEEYLRVHPDDLATRRAVGLSLLADARDEPDESVRAGMLDACIRILSAVVDLDRDTLPSQALGEACYRRALIGPEIDGTLLDEAERALRVASQSDGRPHSESAWHLQRVLRVVPRGLRPEHVTARLNEAHELLSRGVKTSEGASAWKAALLSVEWRRLVASCPNATERRLRFRVLHAAWAPLIEQETSGDMLAAWADLLTGMAETLTGQVAMDRYAEAQRVLARLHTEEGASARYARALTAVALGRARLERGPAKAALLVEADAILHPYVESDNDLRLEACRVTLMRAHEVNPAEARSLYLRAAELARPLTAVPTFSIDALRCMVKALIALDEEKDRRVYAKCLEIVTDPGDAELLLLLAECHLRTGEYRAGCLQSESAWRMGAMLSPALLGLWQAAHVAWAAQAELSAEVTRNRTCLRIAASAHGDRMRVVG